MTVDWWSLLICALGGVVVGWLARGDWRAWRAAGGRIGRRRRPEA